MPLPGRDFDIVLVLSGGNALGAFEAGVYEGLHEHDLHPDWVVGASIGAINAALIAGSPVENRLDTLRTFWRPATMPGWPFLPTSTVMETGRRTAAVGWTAAAGRAGIFGAVLSGALPWTDDRPSIFETNQLADTLARLVDFDRLNDGAVRYTATAVDVETGEDVVFDSRDRRIVPDHVRASAALPIAFPPVAIDGRWCVDGGLSANLPLDPVLADPPARATPRATPRATLCIAVDLLPLAGAVPTTLGDAASRMQDLIFAAQSRRTIARWQAAHAGREDIDVTLVRLAYTDQSEEVAGKALDFSGPTIEKRWVAGRAAGLRLVAQIADGTLPIGIAGLQVVDGASE